MLNNEKFKVVFHIDEINKWDRIIANINNLLKEIDAHCAEISVVANGEAIQGYLMPEKHPALQALFDQKIVLNICQNSMKGFDIQSDELPEFVTIVSAAVLELARKQHEGFAYIKP